MKKHLTEVCDMCLFEYNEKKAMEAERAEGKEEGKEEGRQEERIRLLVKWVRTGKFTVDEAAEEANMNVEEFQKILDVQTKK